MKESLASPRPGAVIHTVLGAGEHVVDVHQREHGEGSDEGAGLDGDAAPQQGGVTRLVKQRPDHHLQIREEAGEDDPGDDLQGAHTGKSGWVFKKNRKK